MVNLEVETSKDTISRHSHVKPKTRLRNSVSEAPMSAEDTNSGPETVTKQSEGRYSVKSPGRVAFMKRLNEEGLGGMGGRRPTHGRRALAELIRRGEQLDGPIGELTRQLETAYAVDYGGDLSTAEKALVKRLVVLDVDLALSIAERDKAKRFTKQDAIAHTQAVSRNCAAYAALVKVLGGPGRREKPTGNTLVVRRYADPVKPMPDNGPGQGQAAAAMPGDSGD